MSSISKNGIYSDWSPYFNYYSDSNFNIAKTLPLPSRIKYQIGSKEDINKDNSTTVDVSEYADILDLYNIYNKNRSNENNYKLFIGRFNSLKDSSLCSMRRNASEQSYRSCGVAVRPHVIIFSLF